MLKLFPFVNPELFNTVVFIFIQSPEKLEIARLKNRKNLVQK